MTARQEAFARLNWEGMNGEGMRFASFGLCAPDCEQCVSDYGGSHNSDSYFQDCEFDPTPTDRQHAACMAHCLETDHWSDKYKLALLPAGEIAADIVAEVLAQVADEQEAAEYIEECGDEGSFSHSPCGICGCSLGGTRYTWHWIDADGALNHESDGCTDCLMLWANGDVPDDEHLDWID